MKQPCILMHNSDSSLTHPVSNYMQPIQDLLHQRTPSIPVTRLLIGANLLVFIAMFMNGAGLWHSSGTSIQLSWGANFGPATQDGEWWRLATALFLHFGVIHLTLNLWALWDGGQLAERMYGHIRFAVIYFASGLAGNLLSLVSHGSTAISGGASGAIFGVYGALLIFIWREREQLHPQEFRWLFWGVIVFSLASIIFGFVITGIDNAAHIGGLITGMLGGIILARPLNPDITISSRTRLITIALLLLTVSMLIRYIPVPAWRWSEEMQARQQIGQFLAENAAISHTWQDIIHDSKQGTISFDELAGRIDSTIGDRYEKSFEKLSGLSHNPALPSAATLEALRHYAEQQRDSSRALADHLRDNPPTFGRSVPGITIPPGQPYLIPRHNP